MSSFLFYFLTGLIEYFDKFNNYDIIILVQRWSLDIKKEASMVRYYKTPDGQALRVDREMVDSNSTEAAVQVSIPFGGLLYTTDSRVQEDDLEVIRLDNAVDAALDGDDDVMLEYLEDDEEKYEPLFAEAEAWIMKEYPGAVRHHELEADLKGM